MAYAILIVTVGVHRRELTITRLYGVMFIGFAINVLVPALPGLVTNKA